MGTIPIATPPIIGTEKGGSALETISKIFQAQQAGLSQSAHTATVPIPGGQTVGPKVSPLHQAGMRPLANNQQYTASGARHQNINNLVTSAGNLVATIENKHKEDEQNKLSVDIERILTAQAGNDQAKQVLSQDPNNKEAKDIIAKNDQILNNVLGDKSKRSKIAKAFDISFTDPSQNKTPENAALQAGIKSYAQQFQESRPTTLQPNQQAQAQFETQLKEQKAATEFIKAVSPAIVGDNKEQHADARNQNTVDSSNAREAARLQSIEQQKELDRKSKAALEQFKQWNANSRNNARIGAARDMNRERIASANTRAAIAGMKPSDMLKANQTYYKSLSQENDRLINESSKLELQKANIQFGDKGRYDKEINRLHDELGKNKETMVSLSAMIEAGMGMQNGDNSTKSTGAGVTKDAPAKLDGHFQQTIGEEDDTDEDSDNY